MKQNDMNKPAKTNGEDLRRDLMDLSIMEERRNEPARPLRDYLNKKGEQV